MEPGENPRSFCEKQTPSIDVNEWHWLARCDTALRKFSESVGSRIDEPGMIAQNFLL